MCNRVTFIAMFEYRMANLERVRVQAYVLLFSRRSRDYIVYNITKYLCLLKLLVSTLQELGMPQRSVKRKQKGLSLVWIEKPSEFCDAV